MLLLTGVPRGSHTHIDRKWTVGPGAGEGRGSECLMGAELQSEKKDTSGDDGGDDCIA